jgi:hypothetical protein
MADLGGCGDFDELELRFSLLNPGRRIEDQELLVDDFQSEDGLGFEGHAPGLEMVWERATGSDDPRGTSNLPATLRMRRTWQIVAQSCA